MAVSGIVLIGYLLAHMYGNLKVFAGQAAFDEYAHHLRTIGEPILPHEGLLWVIRVVLLVAVVAHAYAAVKLWRRNHHGRGGAKRYHSAKAARGVQRSYSSFTLRWGGIIIALFVVFHLLNFTWQVDQPRRRLRQPVRSAWSTASASGGWSRPTRSRCSRSGSTCGTAPGARSPPSV